MTSIESTTASVALAILLLHLIPTKALVLILLRLDAMSAILGTSKVQL
jgi:hypothetical protein